MVKLVLGIALVLLGLLFFLQGIGVVGGSAMTGSSLWAVLGPVIAVVGGFLIYSHTRRA